MIRRYRMIERTVATIVTETIVAPLLKLWTPYGNYYDILPNGDIVRLDLPDFQPSGQWKLVGIEPVKGSGFIPFNQLTPDLVSRLQLSYGNGNPRYTVRDYDHGTQRTWGNTQYHGIRGIYFYNEKERAI